MKNILNVTLKITVVAFSIYSVCSLIIFLSFEFLTRSSNMSYSLIKDLLMFVGVVWILICVIVTNSIILKKFKSN